MTESYQNAYNYNTYYSSSYTDEVGGRTMVKFQPHSIISNINPPFAVVVSDQRQHIGAAP